jgi:GNAT superfamily N-acetyltransferase
MCQVRIASPADTDALLAMGARFFAFSPFARLTTFDPEHARASIEQMREAGVVLVATVDGEIVGGLLGLLTPLWFNQSAMVASEVAWWVDPQYRGGAAGVRLLYTFEAWAKERGATAVSLSDLVLDGEQPAGSLIDKLGYTLVERSHVKVL